jgi:hypothetical protein
MYTGAMGGGCLMLVATPEGKKPSDGTGSRSRLVGAVEELRGFTAGETQPFHGLQIYTYAVNNRGLEYAEVGPSETA